MEEYDIYQDIKQRTGGEIYIGVVGPVRTGKSTFITNFLNKTVIPKMADSYEKERTVDELPQSASGNTVMTTQPKFVPSEAAKITFADKFDVKIRLVDCVGYMVDGATGHEDGGKPRMVNTPWLAEPLPFEEAAAMGTKKVITDHATIGIVMTTDGSIDTGIKAENYTDAEEKVVAELKAINKPFVVIVNTKYPDSVATAQLVKEKSEKYGNTVLPVNVLNMTNADVVKIFEAMLMEFPVKSVEFNLSKWMRALPFDDPLIKEVLEAVKKGCENVEKMSDYGMLNDVFEGSENFEGVEKSAEGLGEGRMVFSVKESPTLFYRALSEECDCEIADEFDLMRKLKTLTFAKKRYDKVASALDEADAGGYGIALPAFEDLELADPVIEKKGGKYGVKLKATAPSYHIVRVDVNAEVSPLMGAQMQSEESVKQLLDSLGSTEESIWKTNVFGKSLEDVIVENIRAKSETMQSDTKNKMRRAMGRIVNEGKGGVICILL